MIVNLPAFDLGHLRGTDSNSLLRFYDQANEVLLHSQSQNERAKARRAIERMAKEFRKRNIVPGGRKEAEPTPGLRPGERNP